MASEDLSSSHPNKKPKIAGQRDELFDNTRGQPNMPIYSTNDLGSRPPFFSTFEQHGPRIYGSAQAGAGATVTQGSNNSNNVIIHYNTTANEKRQILDSIDHAEGAAFDDIGVQARKCVEGTREELLQKIYQWVEDSHDAQSQDKRGFWLQGLAGTGKSTVARTVAEHLSRNGYKVASFFFRRGEEGRSSPQKFVTTVLRQLAHYDELFGPLVKKYNDVGSGQKFLDTEWRLYIQEPLTALTSKKIVLVIDAIDESRELMAVEYAMFNLLSDPANFQGLNLRLFVTARPGEKKENEDFNHIFKLHTIPENIVESDLQKYFRARFQEKQRDSDNGDFPMDEHVKELARQAKPLFIAARTSFDFIMGFGDPEDQYNLLIQSKAESGTSLEGLEPAYVALDRMYLLVIKQALTPLSDFGHLTIPQKTWKDFRQYVGVSITLHEGFSFDALATLLDTKPPRLRRFFEKLCAVLDIPENNSSSMHIFHQSFSDFLKDESRVHMACRAEVFNHEELWIDPIDMNSMILTRCLEVMEGLRQDVGLKENICGLPDRGPVEDMASLGRKINPALKYACTYWVSHLKMGDISEVTVDKVYEFLSRHLLLWIEAMSCLRRLGDAIRQVDEIYNCTQNTSHKDMRAFTADAKRFIRFSKELIEESPLQIYSSALVFAPESSLVKKQFAGRIESMLAKTPLTNNEWDAKLFDFSDHNSRVEYLHFSADGERVASLDSRQSLIVWEAATGQMLWRTEGITCIDVSLDLRKKDCTLAGADGQGNIILWPKFDKSSRYCFAHSRGHNYLVRSLSFSPDGGRLVWVDQDDDGEFMVRTADCRDAVEQLPRDGLPAGFQLQLPSFVELGKLRITNVSQKGWLVALCGAVSRLECIAVWGKLVDKPWSLRGAFDCRPDHIVDFALSSRWLVCVSNEKLQFRDVVSGYLQEIPLDTRMPITRRRLAHVPGSSYIIAPDKGNWLSRYKLGSSLTADRLPKSQSRGALHDMTLSGDGKTLACVFFNPPSEWRFTLWDTGSANRVCVAGSPRSQSYPPILSLSGDGTKIAVRFNGLISLFDSGSLRPTEQQQGPEWVAWSDLIVSPNGSLAAGVTASRDLEVESRRWLATVLDLDKGASRSFTSNARAGSYNDGPPLLLFSPNSKRLAMISCAADNSQIWVEAWHIETKRRDGIATVQSSLADDIVSAAFSLDSELLSFVFQDSESNPKVGVLNLLCAESKSLESHPFPQAVSGDLALGVSAFGTSGFHAALAKKTSKSDVSDQSDSIIQLYIYDWSSMSPTPTLTIPNFPHKCPKTAALSNHLTSPTLIVQNNRGKYILCFLSNAEWKFRRLAPIFDPCMFHRISLCQEGSCLTIDMVGTLNLPLPRHSPSRCSCGSLAVSKGLDSPWVLCQQRPLLRLPNNLAEAQICEVKGTILVVDKDNRLLHRIKLSSILNEDLATQFRSHDYVSPYN